MLTLYIHHYNAGDSIIARVTAALKASAATVHLGEWLEYQKILQNYHCCGGVFHFIKYLWSIYSIDVCGCDYYDAEYVRIVLRQDIVIRITVLSAAYDGYIIAVAVIVAYLYSLTNVKPDILVDHITNTVTQTPRHMRITLPPWRITLQKKLEWFSVLAESYRIITFLIFHRFYATKLK
uniref:Uncharacterized protein n=1 Tax=Schizaphis graminum TaxID=13262 RepID=A0A2S2NB06_SCHGA